MELHMSSKEIILQYIQIYTQKIPVFI